MVRFHSPRLARLWIAPIVAAGLCAATDDVRAAYAFVGGVDGACAFNALYSWNFPPPLTGADDSAPSLGGPNWTYSFSSPAFAASRNLLVRIDHVDPRPCDVVHGAGPTIELEFPNVQRPPDGKPNRVVAKKVKHVTHDDFVVAHLTAPAAGALTIWIRGEHVSNAPPGEWSFVNLGTGTYSKVTVTPSYVDGNGAIVSGASIDGGSVGPGRIRIAGSLPRDDNGNLPTNYTVVAHGSAATHTTLAFLGVVEGLPGITELELGAMIDLFGGYFLAPVLREADQSRDLHVFVDLSLFLGAGVDVVGGALFDFVDGVADGLPGISVFTSPFVLGADGSLTGDRFTGALYVDAAIDGSTIPLPATAVLLAPALLAVALARRSRPGRVC